MSVIGDFLPLPGGGGKPSLSVRTSVRLSWAGLWMIWMFADYTAAFNRMPSTLAEAETSE